MKAKTKKALNAAGFKTYGNWIEYKGVLYPLPLTEGNEKLGDVWNSATAPTNREVTTTDKNGNSISVCGTCSCTCKECYATKNRYNFQSVKYPMVMRTKLLREFPKIYFQLVRIQIECEGIELMRLHASGDFLPVEIKMYTEILKEFPNLKAWTYTKCRMSKSMKALDSLENMNIVKSIIPGFGYNFGHIDYITKVFTHLKSQGKKVYICKCGIDKNQHCEGCEECSKNEFVLFVEHSTGYNPEKEIGYSDFVKLVNSQKGN